MLLYLNDGMGKEPNPQVLCLMDPGDSQRLSAFSSTVGPVVRVKSKSKKV